MGETTRLPVQHRRAPHCPTCKADLPTYDDLVIILPAIGDGPVMEKVVVSIHVVCACGTRLVLQKENTH